MCMRVEDAEDIRRARYPRSAFCSLPDRSLAPHFVRRLPYTESSAKYDLRVFLLRLGWNGEMFKALRNQAREALAAYADGADFDFTIARLAGVGYKMELLLG